MQTGCPLRCLIFPVCLSKLKKNKIPSHLPIAVWLCVYMTQGYYRNVSSSSPSNSLKRQTYRLQPASIKTLSKLHSRYLLQLIHQAIHITHCNHNSMPPGPPPVCHVIRPFCPKVQAFLDGLGQWCSLDTRLCYVLT